jgi:hypothetical protein
MARWQFILSQPDSRGTNPVARRSIRGQAMKSFSQRQRIEKIAEYRQEKARSENGAADMSSQTDFPDGSITAALSSDAKTNAGILEKACIQHRATIPNRQDGSLGYFASGTLDPFDRTAIYNYHDTPRLFMHCTNDLQEPNMNMLLLTFH